MKNNSVRTIVAVGIGAALFFVLGRFVAIPSPVPNTNISTQYGLLAFMAALFGPVAGALIGLIGHALIDFSYGWGIWWSWVIASAIFGIIMGLASKRINLADGEFSTKEILTFNVAQVIGHEAEKRQPEGRKITQPDGNGFERRDRPVFSFRREYGRLYHSV